MTEFCAAIGQNSLSNLDFENKYRNNNVSYFFIKYMNNYGIPFTHAYTPLNHHSNFNIKKNKNESFPNIDLQFKKQKNFNNTYEICYKKLSELSIHRPVNKKHLDFLIKKLNDYIEKYKLR